MSSCIVQYFSSRAKLIVLCVVSVLAVISCASQAVDASAGGYETAKVYLVEKVPVPGESGDFWNGLAGTVVNRHPWTGTPAKTLFVRAEIKDSSPQIRPADMDPAQAWDGTSLQMFFGTTTARHSEYDESDNGLSFWVSHDEEGAPKVMASKGRLLNDRQYKSAVVEWTESSYIIEVSFSLDFLAIYKPFKANQKVRCEFRINHAKEGQPRSVIVNWRTSTDEAWNNPNTWSDGVVINRP